MQRLQPGLLSFCCWNCIQQGSWRHWLSQAGGAALLLHLSEFPTRGTHGFFSRNHPGGTMESTAWCNPQSFTVLGSSRGGIPTPEVIYWWSKKSLLTHCSVAHAYWAAGREWPFKPGSSNLASKPYSRYLIYGFEFSIYNYIKSRPKRQNMLTCSH